MELEVREQGGAERYARAPGRKTYRAGDQERVWDTHGDHSPAHPQAPDG